MCRSFFNDLFSSVSIKLLTGSARISQKRFVLSDFHFGGACFVSIFFSVSFFSLFYFFLCLVFPFYNSNWSSLFYNTITWHEGHEQHKCYTNHTSVAWVKNFDFGNDTSENISSHSYIIYMANEKLQGEEQFYSKN